MKCIITGGAGFIGSNLADRLIALGSEVAIIDNLATGKKEYLNPQAEFYKADICSEEIGNIFKNESPLDFVFHLAAQIDVRKSMEDPEFDNKVNSLGTLNIIKNCAKYKAGKMIFTSTGGAVYGDVERPALENDLIKPSSPYAIHKYAGERYLEMERKLSGLKYAVLRLANVYGPRQYKGGECGVVGIFTNNSLAGVESILYGDGSKTRDYVYVDDVVDALAAAMEARQSGVFNIGTGKETSVTDIIKTIEKITGRKFDYKQGPDMPGEVLRSVLDSRKAEEALGWKAKTGFEDGVGRTLEWIRGV